MNSTTNVAKIPGQPSHQVGDTKSINGVTYRLNENHRWELDRDQDGLGDHTDSDDQHGIVDESAVQAGIARSQLGTVHPDIAGVLRAFHESPELAKGEPYIEHAVHAKLAGKMYALLRSNRGKAFGGGQVVDAGNGVLGFASKAGSLVVMPPGPDGKHRVAFTVQTGLVKRGAGGGQPVEPVAPESDDWPDEGEIATEPGDEGDGDVIGIDPEQEQPAADEAQPSEPVSPEGDGWPEEQEIQTEPDDEEIVDAEPADEPRAQSARPAEKPPIDPGIMRSRADFIQSQLDDAVEAWQQDTERGADSKTLAAHRRNVASLRAIWSHHDKRARQAESDASKRVKAEATAKATAKRDQERAAKAEAKQRAQAEREAQRKAKVGKTTTSAKDLRERDAAALQKPDEPRPLLDVPEGQGGNLPEVDPLEQAALTMDKPAKKAWSQVGRHLQAHGLAEGGQDAKRAIMDAMQKGIIKRPRHLAAVAKAAGKIQKKLINRGYGSSSGGEGMATTGPRESVQVAAIKKAVSGLARRQEQTRETWAQVSKQKAADWDMKPEDLNEVADELFKAKWESHNTREAAKAKARKLTGLSAADIRRFENSNLDHASRHERIPDMAKLGRQLAGEFGDLGWGGGYGDEHSDHDYGKLMWDLIREGAVKRPSKTDPKFVEELDAYLNDRAAGFDFSEGDEAQAGDQFDEDVSDADRAAYEEIMGRREDYEPAAADESVPFQKRLRSGMIKWYYVRQLGKLERYSSWDEGKHPRGQPDNAGQFVGKDGGQSGSWQSVTHKEYRPASPKDLDGDHVFLWHGTSSKAGKAVLQQGQLKDGARGRNAAGDTYHASQYPEDTGAEFLLLLAAEPGSLGVDENDQIGETVADGLFPDNSRKSPGWAYGHGSSVTVGKHRVVAGFDLRNVANQDKAVELLQRGKFGAARKLGVRGVLPRRKLS